LACRGHKHWWKIKSLLFAVEEKAERLWIFWGIKHFKEFWVWTNPMTSYPWKRWSALAPPLLSLQIMIAFIDCGVNSETEAFMWLLELWIQYLHWLSQVWISFTLTSIQILKEEQVLRVTCHAYLFKITIIHSCCSLCAYCHWCYRFDLKKFFKLLVTLNFFRRYASES
jgi:hypothetical protein